MKNFKRTLSLLEIKFIAYRYLGKVLNFFM